MGEFFTAKAGTDLARSQAASTARNAAMDAFYGTPPK
jgi:hypothetical protein